MIGEEWRRIPSCPAYEASSEGRIRSFLTPVGRILRQHVGTHGYVSVHVRGAEGPKRTATVHSLVAEAFHGPRPAGMEVRHLNGNRLDPRPVNLAYSTHSENMLDRRIHGTCARTARTHCPQGHEYTEANTYRCKRGGRSCKTCSDHKRRERYFRDKGLQVPDAPPRSRRRTA